MSLLSTLLVKRVQIVEWELASESLYESFLNSHVLVKREQELYESSSELTSEILCESFLISHVLVKREQELYESWWEFTSESLYESFLNFHASVMPLIFKLIVWAE